MARITGRYVGRRLGVRRMKTSSRGIQLIKSFEGCHLTAYKCPAGVWTIGYGHTAGVKEGQTITQAQADAYLASDLEKYEKYVANTKLDLNQNQFDALVSFAYNCGQGNLKTLTQNRTMSQIAAAMLLYTKSGGKVLQGLVRRRQAEYDLFVADMKIEKEGKTLGIKTYSKSSNGNMNISENFKVKEFACKNGSDPIKVDELLVCYLQKARDYFKVPIILNSAYRTSGYNKQIGGAKNSYHVKGQATDLHTNGKVDLFELARFFESIGCQGIIVYPNSGFVHIDTRDSKYLAVDYGKTVVKKDTFGATTIKNQTGICTGDSVRLRKTASLTGKILAKLYKNDTVAVLGTSGTWSKVRHNGTIGYMASQYVKNLY